MGEILVGTCSWTDRALVGSGWYPAGRRDAEGRLRRYAAHFPVVEADSTYYALPAERTSRLWAERTPDGFVFDVKAFSLLTGHPTRPAVLPPGLPADVRSPKALDEVWRRFAGRHRTAAGGGAAGRRPVPVPALAAARRAGRGVPRRVRRAHRRLAGLRRVPAPRLVARRTGAYDRRVAAVVRVRAVAVDMEPSLPSAVPPVTSPQLSVVRFHGRSPAWGTGSKEDRFRHEYTDDELREWLPRVRAPAGRAERMHVLFNNCCADASVRAAARMRELLGP